MLVPLRRDGFPNYESRPGLGHGKVGMGKEKRRHAFKPQLKLQAKNDRLWRKGGHRHLGPNRGPVDGRGRILASKLSGAGQSSMGERSPKMGSGDSDSGYSRGYSQCAMPAPGDLPKNMNRADRLFRESQRWVGRCGLGPGTSRGRHSRPDTQHPWWKNY